MPHSVNAQEVSPVFPRLQSTARDVSAEMRTAGQTRLPMAGTMVSPEQMRTYVFPWHRQIVAGAHAAGKPAILHSCGNPRDIIEEVIEDMRLDARHSCEDNILPVADVCSQWQGRIAVMGGLDVGFLCSAAPADILKRARSMLERSRATGGYALGSGNSVPTYVPTEHCFAMLSAAWETL